MRFAQLALIASIFLGPAALADEIHHLQESRDQYMNVEIVDVDFKTVTYKFLDERMRSAGEQKENMDKVARLVFTVKPPEYESAESYYEQQNYQNAAGSFRRAMTDRSRNSWVDQYSLYYIAKCHEAMGETQKAVEAYQDLLKKFPRTIHLADANLSLAEIQVAAGRTKDAKSTLEALIQSVKQNSLNRSWSLRANLYLQRIAEGEGDVDGARKGYRDLASEAEGRAKDIFYQARLGYARCLLSADPGEAQGVFQQLANDRDLADASVLAGVWNGLAACHFEKKEYKSALLAALHVVTMYGDYAPNERPQAYFCAAACFYLLRDKGENWEGRAADLFDRLRREYPGSPWSQQSYKNPPSLIKKPK